MKRIGLFLFVASGLLFAQTKTLVVAGGCFWCMEPPFDKTAGVLKTISGYAGGKLKNPTYQQVSSGTTEHIEVVQITYDPKKVSVKKLLDVFWRNVDPTQKDGQFVDKGRQYRTAIFYASAEEKNIAEKSKKEIAKKFKKPIVTDLIPLKAFYPAEDYHQDYYKKNPLRYKYYRYRSGRDQFLKKTWGEK